MIYYLPAYELRIISGQIITTMQPDQIRKLLYEKKAHLKKVEIAVIITVMLIQLVRLGLEITLVFFTHHFDTAKIILITSMFIAAIVLIICLVESFYLMRSLYTIKQVGKLAQTQNFLTVNLQIAMTVGYMVYFSYTIINYLVEFNKWQNFEKQNEHTSDIRKELSHEYIAAIIEDFILFLCDLVTMYTCWLYGTNPQIEPPTKARASIRKSLKI